MKEKTYYYSASTNSFYPISMREDYEKAGTLPNDLIKVDDDVFNEFSQNKEGFYRSSDEKSHPVWVEIPPISQEEIDAQKEIESIAFLSSETRRTSDAIEVLNDAIEFELATNEEMAQHKELRKYRLMLSRVQNQQEWPLNPIWPECPEFFKTKE